MYSFLLSILALLAGYFFYGKLVEKVFHPEPSRVTPAVSKADGVDFIAMPSWKVYMIQFLNIAGTGPIFGAIMGAKFGPSSYLWVVFGCIFAGAVHDYLSGMLSLRNDGAGLPELIGKYLGKTTKTVMLCFSLLVLVLVGAVFVYSPAILLGDIAGDGSTNAVMCWVGVIFIYYILAAILPIDKLVGRIYPIFAAALLFMAIALLVCLLVKWPSLPEFWDGLGNLGQDQGLISGQSIFPCLFITIACGAISGFHATQSPMMARCMKNERLGRPVFYGSMITEGLVALIWAAIGSYFFFDGGAAELGSSLSAAAPTVVSKVSVAWLGVVGGVLSIIGVVVAPITSGDTAFRSARLIIADFLHSDQKPIGRRLAICIPLFALSALLLWFNIANEDGFNIIWRYFGWANQTLSVFTLWMLSVFLVRERKGYGYLMALIPAAFMTSVCLTYIATAKIGFNLPAASIPYLGIGTFILSIAIFFLWKSRRKPSAC